MSNNSSDERKCNTGWQWPEPEFPSGLHPEEDLFSDETVGELLRLAGRQDLPNRGELQRELRNLASKYIKIALSTPLGVPYGPDDTTLSKRAAWLASNILNPCSRLLDAISDEQAPMLSDWPDAIPIPEPDRVSLQEQLMRLQAWGSRLRADLLGRFHDGANHTTEFERDLVFRLTVVFQSYFPAQSISRGTFDPEHGMDSRFTAFQIRLSR